MKLTHYLLAVVVFGAWTTQGCLAKAPRPVAKATGGAGPSASAGSQQGSGAKGAADTVKGATGGKTEAGNPIDMAIPEPRRAPTNTSKPIDWKKIGVVGVPSISSQPGAMPALSGLSRRQNYAPGTAGVAKNAIAPMPPVSPVTGPGTIGVARSAIGAPMHGPQPGVIGTVTGRQGPALAPAAGVQAFPPKAVEGVVGRNAVGSPAVANAATGGTQVNTAAIGRPIPAPVLPAATPMNHAVINGTGIGRPVTGPPTVGGAAKNVTAVISGSSFRPKLP